MLKNGNSLKDTLLLYLNFLNWTLNPDIWCTNINSDKTILYYRQTKSIGCLFFLPILQEKIAALMPIFCQKIVQSLKNSALMSFASTFYEKNHRDMLIFSQKSVDAVKTTPYYGLKKSIGYPFLYDFH